MIAEEIIELIGVKHSGDVFIPECKDGPTQGTSHSRLDAWAMRRSWSNPGYYGYEVKVSRSDFLGDTKWTMYLPLCNELYFVCPSKLIMPDEVPQQCGLLWVSKTGTRLYTKKKAPFRDIEPPIELLHYALMRARGFSAWYDAKSGSLDQLQEWSEWLGRQKRGKEVGSTVAGIIRRMAGKRVSDIEFENARLKKENDRLAEVKTFIESMGIDIGGWRWEENIENALTGNAPTVMRSALKLGLRQMLASLKQLRSLDKYWDEHEDRAKAKRRSSA